jgi:hypothetical protein
MEKADLFREAVEVFVRVQAAKRLAALGGAAPGMKPVPRRRAPAGAARRTPRWPPGNPPAARRA